MLPQGHRLEKRRQVSWLDIQSEQLVSLPADSRTRRLIDATAITNGLTLTHAITVTQFTTMMQFVAAGVGIAIVPEGALSAASVSPGLSARPLEKPKLSRTMGLVALKSRNQTYFANKMIELVMQEWRGI